jgi:signal transduction histidine kinase
MERMIAELLELNCAMEGFEPRARILCLFCARSRRAYRTDRSEFALSRRRRRHVYADGDKVRTVLRNLLENAAKYSLPTSRPVEISSAQNADTVVIRVTDDGVGISEGDLERALEPFFRVDRSGPRAPVGTVWASAFAIA